jgi:hypothetical protein
LKANGKECGALMKIWILMNFQNKMMSKITISKVSLTMLSERRASLLCMVILTSLNSPCHLV